MLFLLVMYANTSLINMHKPYLTISDNAIGYREHKDPISIFFRLERPKHHISMSYNQIITMKLLGKKQVKIGLGKHAKGSIL